LAPFRVTGSNKGPSPDSGTTRRMALNADRKPADFLIVSSDSGRITVVEYLPEENRFSRVHMETYGKSGVRRVVPGEYLVCDPKGRAFLVASIEKNKLVYILNRVSGATNPDGNLAAELTISSPLEAHKPRVLVLSMVALDVGYSNPVFAA